MSSPAGRHRYFRLPGDHIAKLVEQLQCFAPPRLIATPSQRRSSAALQQCRLCYDHLGVRGLRRYTPIRSRTE